MRLESALYTGKEGITAHGQAISVVGDNIANSNTVGFKGSRVEFGDLLGEGKDGYQSGVLQAAGDGVAVREVRQLFAGGTIESTGRTLDVGIDGEGFFMVGDAANPSYTRAGNFSFDAAGQLVNAEGLPLLGIPGNGTGLGALSIANLALNGSVTTNSAISGNLDSRLPLTELPENPQSFRDINAFASYAANANVFDSLGDSHNVSLYFFKTEVNTWTAQAYMDGAEVGGTEGVPVQVGEPVTLSYGPDGAIAEADQAAAIMTATPAYSNGAAAGNFTIDLSGFTQYASPAAIGQITQDGVGTGNIQNYEITTDGRVEAVLDSGARQLVGTLQLADFVNRDGLQRMGNSLYRAGDEVGDITVNNPGEGSLGVLRGGALERSTVDISTEFVELVLLQRGYQANSQTLTTANQLLKDTLSLIR